jgi:purine-binding chemotaxis protein CheW
MLNELNHQNSPENSDEMHGKYLTFWTDSQLFGIPISDVVQIVGIQKVTEVPEFPEYAKGIINLRGSIIPIISVRLRLHKEEISYNERTCIIITNIRQKLIGFIVDAVDEVTKIEREDISDPPKITTDDTNTVLIGIAKLQNKSVLLLDSEKFLNNEIRNKA